MLRKIFYRTVLTTLLFVAGITQLHADEVILKPGYLAGRVSFGENYSIRNFNISTIGGGYSASQYFTNITNYTLTTQGGPWDNKVVASASAVGGNGSVYFYFSDRTLQVPADATVVNDYVYNPGIVRFEVTISGDQYSYWRGNSRGEKPVLPGQEKTSTSMGTNSFYSDGAWEMPVVPNQQISLTASVGIDGPGYNDYKSFPFNFGLRDIAPGEKVVIPIHIDYVAPPAGEPPPPPPPSPTYYNGYMKGTAWLKGVPENEVWFHTIILNRNTSSYRYVGNPVEYSGLVRSTNPNAIVTGEILTGTHFRDFVTGGPSSFLQPYITGSPKNTIAIPIGGTTYKDFITETGVLTGKLTLLGAPPLEQFTGSINFGGASLQTQNGIGHYVLHPQNPAQSFKAYLSEGEWTPQTLDLKRVVTTPTSYTSSLRINFLDQDEADKELDIAAMPYVVPGESVTQDMTLCLGDVIYRFRDISGNPLTSSSMSGTGTRVVNGKTVLSMTASSSSTNPTDQSKQLEIFGPAGSYQLTSTVYAADGSRITYPLMTKALSCGVQEVIDIPGPTLRVLSPQAALVTNGATITVNGNVSSPSTIQSVLINDQLAVLTPSGNPANSGELQFSATVALQPGANTLVTTVIDASGAEARDTRIIYADLWLPTVAIVAPSTGTLVWYDDSVTVQIDAADQGYGSTLTLYLDGKAIYQVTESGSDSTPRTNSYSRTIGPLAVGEHQLIAEVVDAAGNSVSATSTIVSFLDNWPPAVEIGSPATGSIFAGNNDTIPVVVTATDQGSGFILNITIDGIPLYSVTGAANLIAPEPLTFNATGPFASGSHTITAVVTDSAGNQATTEGSFLVDGWQPQVTILAPVDGSYLIQSTDTIPLQVVGTDQGYGYTMNIYLDNVLLYQRDGVANSLESATLSFNEIIASLTLGDHLVRAEIIDAAGNYTFSTVTITSYLGADVIAKPEARHNNEEGISTIFVSLPNGLASVASLHLEDNREISAQPDQQPIDVKLSDDKSKLILKFQRTPELMADSTYTLEGKLFPNPQDPSQFYYWRGTDSTQW